MDCDEYYMLRALQLARAGRGHVSPNPMVGAVVVAGDGRIIGEGWHRRFGGPHAEVNAFNSIAQADSHLISGSTVYVTLEPCSHYGKTPPCAAMLVEKHPRRVVVGSGDPNPRVAGRGIAMLREAGIEVCEGVLSDECRSLNKRFMTAHNLHRPFVTLKWAESADGFIDGTFSGPEGRQLVHLRRSVHDAIIVGAGTVIADNPRLDVRDIAGNSPHPIVLDRHNMLENSSIGLMRRPDTMHTTDGRSIADLLDSLYADEGITSVLVEGGAAVLRSFLDAGLWDEAYVERSPHATGGKTKAPLIEQSPVSVESIGENTLYGFYNRR